MDDCSKLDSIPKDLIKRALETLMSLDTIVLFCDIIRATRALRQTSEDKETALANRELLLSEKLRLEERSVKLFECLRRLRELPITPNDRVGVGSLVDVNQCENCTCWRKIYFIADDCWTYGGEKLWGVVAISAASPAAQALMGKQAGEEADCLCPDGTTIRFHILAVK